MSATATLRLVLEVVDTPDFDLNSPRHTQRAAVSQSAVYTIKSEALTGYSSSDTLVVSGLPTGATGTFGANPLGPNSSTTLTITNLSVTGTFPITVQGTQS